ncbi:hypothetical protein [Amycolatopsis dongchuanensis]|uniref:Uncharacterized protein n=1 Tax=Amycolatopsis dongchuanensis TaxID=1070866 RepID=A0ABP8VAQ7_9PSEU
MTIPQRTSDFLNPLMVGEPGDWLTGKGRIAYPTRAQVLDVAGRDVGDVGEGLR